VVRLLRLRKLRDVSPEEIHRAAERCTFVWPGLVHVFSVAMRIYWARSDGVSGISGIQ